MSNDTEHFVGARYNPDGTVEAVTNGDRWIMRLDDEFLTLDPEVTIEGQDGYYTLRAPFTEATVMTTPASRIISHERHVDQPRMLADFQRTGQRTFRMDDYLIPL